MRSNPIRAVFFDLDDTLCDTTGTREARARLAFEALAREKNGLDQAWFLERVLEPIVPTAVRGVPEVAAELGLAETAGGRRAMDIWFFDGVWDLLKPLPDVVPTIKG